MSKPITLSRIQWVILKNRLYREFPRSTLLIREKMKERLGFVVREHSYIQEDRYEQCICLDFYNEPKRTMFILKYSDYLDNKKYLFLCRNKLTSKEKYINIYEWKLVKDQYEIIDQNKFNTILSSV